MATSAFRVYTPGTAPGVCHARFHWHDPRRVRARINGKNLTVGELQMQKLFVLDFGPFPVFVSASYKVKFAVGPTGLFRTHEPGIDPLVCRARVHAPESCPVHIDIDRLAVSEFHGGGRHVLKAGDGE